MSKGEIKFNDLSQLAAALELRDRKDQENTETDSPAAQQAQSAKKRKEKPVHNTVSENAAEPSSDTGKETGYVPDPLEAAALKALGKKWRYYTTKKEFDDTIAELSRPTKNLKITKYEEARYKTIKNLFGSEHNKKITPENIEFAEKFIRENKVWWSKIQAAHFWNSVGFIPEIPFDESLPDAQAVLTRIKEKIDKLKKGSFTDGKYTPSEEEKRMLNALHNYGIYPRSRKGKDFAEILKNSITRIMHRLDYQTAAMSEKHRTAKTAPQEKTNTKNKNTTEDKKMTENNAYSFSEDDKKIAEELGLNTSDYKTLDDFHKAVDKVLAARNQISAEANLAEEGHKKQEKTKDTGTENQEKTTNKATNRIKPLNIQQEATPEKQPIAEKPAEEEIAPWIKRKAEWYQSQANQGKISGYEWHKEQKDCFAASVEGSEIHYDSPDNVKVSDNASYKVFDAIMKEEDNKGRPINFPENASKEVATRLYAACVMNGNPMQGAVPKELDEAALQSCGLSAEQMGKVKEQFAKNNGQQQAPKETQNAEQLPLSEAAKKELNELGKEIMELQEAGKIEIIKSKDKKIEILRGSKGTDSDVKIAQEKSNTINKIKETGLSTGQQALSALRKRIADKNDTEIQTKLQDKQKMRDLIHAKRLGLTSESVKDHKGNDVQTLSADKQQSYARNLSNETKARIGFKGNDGR